ncbi:multidrug effflux MFS transporter [Paracoccus sp. (in: a-proteobacteria)]|uniref:multidrug effflux MFS transporter n=1 Tax=Paracoccus sp. TaxID=267 RepID=UPI0026E04A6D|nr:multidrug effflux MFS transporter [Paracoccus sp. (in: a-proteobacteria)]MDO5648247.1 multidrug effflux MFS transporter [Paracoccus sp. (in: a-proteobacteria)]
MRPPRTPPHILTLVVLSGLAALSMNVFLPSLPGMARYFGVDYRVMQLSVTAYLGASAALQLLVGPLSDRFGRRPVTIGALLIFLGATLGSLLAPTAGWFLVFRIAQAVVATCMVLSRAAVRDMVAGDRAASMIGYVTMGMSLVPMIAPSIGGALDEAFGWKANFSMLGLAGAAVLVLVWFDMGETAQAGGTPLRQQFRSYPLLARSVRFWGYCLTATLSSGAFFAYLGGAPFVGEVVFHLTPAQVGSWFAAPSVGYLAGNFLSGRWAARVGVNRMVFMGALITAGAMIPALLADLAGVLRPLIFFGAVAVMGLGNGLVLPSANAGMMSVRPELAGTASGLGGAMIIGGGALLAGLTAALLTETSGATPLLAIMSGSGLGGIAAIWWVIRRERQIFPGL